MFIVKYDASGTVLWAQSAGEIGDDYGRSIITDDFNNIYVAGSFQSPYVNFGATSLVNSDTTGVTRDMFIVKYDSAGTIKWAVSAGGINEEFARALTKDASGNIFLAGNYNSQLMVIGSDTLVNAGTYDMFLLKVNQAGNFIWSLSGGGTGTDYGNSIAADILGNVYVSGGFASPINYFGTVNLTNSGIFNMYLVKYNPSGNCVWARKSGGTGSDDGYDVSTNHAGDVFVTGYFNSPSLVFGMSTLINAGNTDIFLVKYDDSGTEQWAKSAGGIQEDIGICVTTNATDVYVAGYFRSNSIMFSGTLTNSGGDDVFIAKIGNGVTGIPENNFSKFLLYPNPANEFIQIRDEGIESLKIYDISGRVIQFVLKPVPEKIDVQKLSTGLYTVEVETRQGIIYEKLIISH